MIKTYIKSKWKTVDFAGDFSSSLAELIVIMNIINVNIIHKHSISRAIGVLINVR